MGWLLQQSNDLQPSMKFTLTLPPRQGKGSTGGQISPAMPMLDSREHQKLHCALHSQATAPERLWWVPSYHSKVWQRPGEWINCLYFSLPISDVCKEEKSPFPLINEILRVCFHCSLLVFYWALSGFVLALF